ncbi:MAG: hypothetical protein JW722_03540 [Demequinaceae bacterium]|nr:hypothetical protein [Demequinaceae bacterium]
MAEKKNKNDKERPSLVELAEELGTVMPDLPEEPEETKTGEEPIKRKRWFRRQGKGNAWGMPQRGSM